MRPLILYPVVTNFRIILDKIRSCICYSRCSSSVRDHLPACSKQQPHPDRDYYKIKRSKNRYIWTAAASSNEQSSSPAPGSKADQEDACHRCCWFLSPILAFSIETMFHIFDHKTETMLKTEKLHIRQYLKYIIDVS